MYYPVSCLRLSENLFPNKLQPELAELSPIHFSVSTYMLKLKSIRIWLAFRRDCWPYWPKCWPFLDSDVIYLTGIPRWPPWYEWFWPHTEHSLDTIGTNTQTDRNYPFGQLPAHFQIFCIGVYNYVPLEFIKDTLREETPAFVNQTLELPVNPVYFDTVPRSPDIG